jgi:hypothetical protein
MFDVRIEFQIDGAAFDFPRHGEPLLILIAVRISGTGETNPILQPDVPTQTVTTFEVQRGRRLVELLRDSPQQIGSVAAQLFREIRREDHGGGVENTGRTCKRTLNL